MKLAVLSILLLSGCAAMYGSPAERWAKNDRASSRTLCVDLATKTMAPAAVRREWAQELDSRGEDCSRYAASINAATQKNIATMQQGLQMMNQSYPATYQSPQVTCSIRREWVSGMNKNCVYDCLGSEAVETIGAAQICPLSIKR